MTVQGITDKARAILNETGEAPPLELLSEDTVRLNDYIRSVIPDAVFLISKLKECPPRYLNAGEIASGTVNADDGCTTAVLPADFIRLVAVRLEGWKREVQSVFPYGSEEYKKQHNAITRSGVNKPVCVFANSQNNDTIECFPSGDILYFRYVANLSEINDNELGKLGDELFESICYMCAYLVYSIFENPGTADRMKTIAIEMLPTDL
ncbi:MAG: hypothetical protein LBU37_10320 [Tannerellaceae bacterium]|jgi:hypothetical protein|nr:hypothetical protein [Tannerellaceae bacterium]